MAWVSPRTWVTAEVVTASHMNTHVRDNLNETAPAKATAAGIVLATGTNTIAVRAQSQAVVNTLETTASSSFTDLTTSGPAVTLTTGTAVLIAIAARLSSTTAGCAPSVGYAVTGATSVSASSTVALIHEVSAANDIHQGSYVLSQIGLSSGSNTFTLKYADTNAAGTATFANRRITVFPLN